VESEADDAPTDPDERCERDERREYDGRRECDEESDRRASGPIPDDEREALETIAHGAVLTSGGVAGQRALRPRPSSSPGDLPGGTGSRSRSSSGSEVRTSRRRPVSARRPRTATIYEPTAT